MAPTQAMIGFAFAHCGGTAVGSAVPQKLSDHAGACMMGTAGHAVLSAAYAPDGEAAPCPDADARLTLGFRAETFEGGAHSLNGGACFGGGGGFSV